MLMSLIREVFIAQHAVDFRKGPDGLLAECYAMDLDPYKGECVIFLHRSRRALKIICGNEHGLCVTLRRFEGGAMKQMFPFLVDRSFVAASHAELAMLIEGSTFEVKSRARPWRKKSSTSPGAAPSSVLSSRNYERPTGRKKEKERPKSNTTV